MKMLLAALVLLCPVQEKKSGVTAHQAADLPWTSVGDMSTHVQWGDPAKGAFQMLIKFPAGLTVPPHFHKFEEFATVVSGTILFGQGETLDEAKGVELSAGAYLFVPAGAAHWLKAKTETVITRFGAGPRDMNPLKEGEKAPSAAPIRTTAAKDVKWEPSPGMAPGILTVLQYGDPAVGPYIILLKFPAGTFNPPHWHTADEVVTILSGSIITGEGETVDEARGKAVGPGGYFLIPGKTAHWGKVPQGDIVLTRLGNGPRDIHYFGAKK